MRPKDTQSILLFFFFIMSVDLMVSALRRGKNGDEILSILNALTGNSSDTASTEDVSDQPTLEPIEF
jgi:hypothetical protein